MTSAKAWLDVYIGDRDKHDNAKAVYDATDALLQKNWSIYGLPTSLTELSEEQQQILKELDVHRLALLPLSFDPLGSYSDLRRALWMLAFPHHRRFVRVDSC